jgi:hypothetical protein
MDDPVIRAMEIPKIEPLRGGVVVEHDHGIR